MKKLALFSMPLILLVLLSCSGSSRQTKDVRKLTFEDSVDMALKWYSYINYADSSDFLVRDRKIAFKNDTLCIVFVDVITILEDNSKGAAELEYTMWKKPDGWKLTTMPYYGEHGNYPIVKKYPSDRANRMLDIAHRLNSPKDIKFIRYISDAERANEK